jgi:4-amino-4-deoxy-L-arabinose transferase-like glycosyltransferase
MEVLHTIWSFLLLFSLILFAQLLGALAYFKLERSHLWLARVVGVVIALFTFVGFSWMIFIYRYYKLHPDDRDGGQLLGASLIIMMGAVIEILLSVVSQVLLSHRTSKARS